MGVATESVCSGGAILAAIAAADSTVTDVAREAGVPRNRLSEALHGRRNLPAQWLEKLPIPVLTPIVAALAERCGFGLVDLPQADEARSDVQVLAALVKEHADVVGVYSDAITDGYLTAAEASRIEGELAELERVIRSLRLRMRTAVRERVIGVAV